VPLGIGIGRGLTAPGPRGPLGQLLKRGGFYTAGKYAAYSDLWALPNFNIGHVPVEDVDYEVGVRVFPGSFPALSEISFRVPHLDSNLNGRNVLDEFYLTKYPGYTSDADFLYEIGLLIHVPTPTIAYINAATQVGIYVDEIGRSWQVAIAPAVAVNGYVMAMALDHLDATSLVDRRRYLRWLIAQGIGTGNEFVNGTAVMVEPLSGSGKVRIDSFDVTLTEGVAATNLVTQPDDATNAYWTKDGVTTPAADTIMEDASTSSHTQYNMTLTRAAGVKTFTAWAEAEGIGRDYGLIKLFSGFFGAGFASLIANLTTGAVTAQSASGGWTIANPFVTSLPGSTKKRFGFDVTVDDTTTNFTLAVGPNNGALSNYAGDVTKGIKVQKIKVFDSTIAPRRMAVPVLSAGSGQISVDRASVVAGPPALSYDLRYSTDGATWTVVAMTTDPQTITGLTNGTPYQVQTRANNSAGNGDWSASASKVPGAGTSMLSAGSENNLLDAAWANIGSAFSAKTANSVTSASASGIKLMSQVVAVTAGVERTFSFNYSEPGTGGAGSVSCGFGNSTTGSYKHIAIDLATGSVGTIDGAMSVTVTVGALTSGKRLITLKTTPTAGTFDVRFGIPDGLIGTVQGDSFSLT
jgi:hypothetical protein